MSAGTATAAGLQLDIVLFSKLLATTPERRRIAWTDLVLNLSQHDERAEKDGPGWSPAQYRPDPSPEDEDQESITRKNSNVLEVTAAALDHDGVVPHVGLLEAYEYVAHTTFSHSTDKPSWRVVIPFSEPCPVKDWPETWLRIRYWLGPEIDESAKDESRLYYWPTAQPGAERHARYHAGELLDWRALPAVPDAPKAPPRTEQPSRGGRVGDRFMAATDWADILEPHGWTVKATLATGVRRWLCNGSTKQHAWCATTGGGNFDVLYPFCPVERGPFEMRTSVTKIHAYVLLNHDGDYQAAIKELSHRGFGEPSPTLSYAHVAGSTNGTNGHSHDAIPPDDGEVPHDPAPPAPRRYPLTDYGNAERLVTLHGSDIRYCHLWNKFLVWDGTRWRLDDTAEVIRRAKLTIRGLYGEAQQIADEHERAALAKHAIRSEATAKIEAMIRSATSENGIPILPDELDVDPWVLNVHNGTLDLRTGELRPHRREDRITKLAPTTYDAAASCPTWDTYLRRVFGENAALIAFMRRLTGYSLTGQTVERILATLHGGGANGKTTYLEVIGSLLGDYAMRAPATTLLAKRDTGIPNDIARLKGARFVWTSETEEGRRLAEALLKEVTGGDTLTARFMRGEWFDFRPEFKVWLATNHKPVIKGTDSAVWDRIRLVPFNVRIPEGERDKHLAAKLRAELPGILAWAVRGCLEWQRDGLGTPEEVRQATDSYRTEMDILGQFLAECCIRLPHVAVTVSSLYDAYVKWCKDTGEQHPMRKNELTLRIQERNLAGVEQRRNHSGRYWQGIGLVDQAQTTFDGTEA